MSSSASKVITTAGIVSVGVGSANAVLKYKTLPSWKFLAGSGLAFMLLSAMANTGEAMGEIAKGLALGVMTTVLLGEGGGLLSYVAGPAETDTTRRRIMSAAEQDPDPDARRRIVRNIVPNPRGGFRADHLPPIPGVPPTNNR